MSYYCKYCNQYHAGDEINQAEFKDKTVDSKDIENQMLRVDIAEMKTKINNLTEALGHLFLATQEIVKWVENHDKFKGPSGPASTTPN